MYFINCTIIFNESTNGAAIVIRDDSPEAPQLINCIVYNNEPSQIQLGYDANRSIIIHVDHCNVEGGENSVIMGETSILYWHEGNIDELPQFSEIEPYPFSIIAESPCVDAGTLDLPIEFELPVTDLAGNPRISGDTIDMGCYEYQYPDLSTDDEMIFASGEMMCYPNPFNPETTISFSIPEQADNAELSIYNLKGQRIRKLKIENVKCKIRDESGKCNIVWDGRDGYGNAVSSGVYFCRVKCGENTAVHKMMMMK